MKKQTCLFVMLALAGSVAFGVQKKPNIVLIVADDLGFENLGCYGSKAIKSPVLDQLAANGLRCTDFHSNGSVCSPTRAALMTGKYQQRVGIDGVVKAASKRHVGVALEEVTVAEALKKQGYATAMFGKWHIGYAPEYNPVNQGFDEFRGFVSGNIDQFSHVDQVGWYDWWHQDELVDGPGYFPKLITDHAIDFIDRNTDKPFFLYLPHAAPHYPIQGPNDKPGRKVTQGNFDPPSHTTMKFSNKGKKIARAGTGNIPEMMAFMDAQIGRVIDHLEAKGLTENTLVVFMSDNGPSSNVSTLDERLLNGRKGEIYEGGHRVPAIFYWPGKIKPGVSDATMIGTDLMPTFMHLAGASTGFEGLDGADIRPVLFEQAELPDRNLFWMQFGSKAFTIRRGPWKLIQNKGSLELYNLEKDLAETSNVVEQYPEVAKELKAELEAMIEELGKVKRNA